MRTALDVVSLVLVGAFWGCTNPLLRKGSTEVAAAAAAASSPPAEATSSSPDQNKDPKDRPAAAKKVIASLSKFRNVRVWLPYALNQFGSLLFYFTLSQSDLSLAGPISNALALVFSVATSYAIGEEVNQPVRTVVGSAFVVAGVAICLLSKQEQEQSEEPQKFETGYSG